MTKSANDLATASKGWRRVLESPGIFNFFQKVSGAHGWKKRIIAYYAKPVRGEKLLDIGCGTGPVLGLLDPKLEIAYTGCDISAAYIAHAKQTNPHRGSFYACEAKDLPAVESDFDLALAIALFHHMEDAAAQALIGTVKDRLRSGARFIIAEPVWTENQPALTRYVMSKDRGGFIRTEQEYLRLLGTAFSVKSAELVHDSHFIPWTVTIITCEKP